jgi:amino acid adenylation domain-containing protein
MTGSLLHERVSHQAELRPHAVALVMGERSMTYGELERRSNQLARLLQATGCRPGDRVGLLLPKSVEAITGILAALKAGCIYVPMDPTFPAVRLESIMRSCKPRCILAIDSPGVNQVLADDRVRNGTRVGWMESGHGGGETEFGWDDLDGVPATAPDGRQRSTDLAHILFTSGSTGAPKGVMITHSNVIHFIEWATRYFGTGPSDRISGHPPLIFDLSTFDIFGTLSSGAALHLVPPEMSLLPHKLADFIRGSELTQWFSVPSLLNYMARFDVVRQGDFPALRRLLWCGEAFPTPALMYWMKRLPHVSFTNLYGPTETTIASSFYRVPSCPEDERVMIPVGTACEGEELLVLNERLEPVGPGEIGEVCIGGVGLSRGYWRDPRKTRAVFVRKPGTGERIYRTGDLASIGPDGLVYLHGRADSQVKSRGYRVELGEIERVLHAIEGLRESAVVAVEMEGGAGVVIVGAYVPSPGAEISPRILRRRISDVLPHYMVPVQWLCLAALPRNASGKIDRPKLQEQFRASAGGSPHDPRVVPSGDVRMRRGRRPTDREEIGLRARPR